MTHLDDEQPLTLITERHTSDLNSKVLFGPQASSRNEAGEPIACVQPGTIVVYCIATTRPHTFVFRTGPASLRISLFGVSQPVTLLIETRTSGRHAKLGELFAFLERRSILASTLPDSLYLRLGALLNGRLPRMKVLQHLVTRSIATRHNP